MPDDDWIDVRQQIAFGHALDAFEARLDRDATLGELRAEGPWFATGVGAFGMFFREDQVVAVEVDINDLGHTVRTGALDARVRAIIDTAGAARLLAVTEGEAEQIVSRVEQSLRAGITAYDQATAAFDLEQQRLTRNMDALADGLERITRVYGEHVTLEYEDPEAFGGGHMVLYPMTHTNARFAIEERYTGSDWSDPDRLPTSWAWRAERLARRTDGSHGWQVSARGAVESDDVATLLRQAETWAKRTRDIAVRADAYRQNPPGRTPPEGPRL
jgi:hypothetical protein